MKFNLWVETQFHAAHQLMTIFGVGHKCAQLHGHTYTVRVCVAAPDEGQDFIVDYDEMLKRLEQEAGKLEHKMLNEVVKEPTTENLCRWFMTQLKDLKPSEVCVRESPNTGCTLSR